MFDRLEAAENRYEEINHRLSDPQVLGNQDEYRKLMKEHSELGDIVAKYREYKKVNNDIKDARELLDDDIVSGATYSSKVILKAIENALDSAVK